MSRGNRTNPPRISRTLKDNFWSRQRVLKNLTISEVAEMLGIDDSRVGMWFTGQLMPSDFWISEVCKLFDVDYNEGQLKFQEAHLNWKAEHSAEPKLIGTNKNSKTVPITNSVNNIEDALTTVYGIVSCSEFIDIYNAVIGRVPEDIDFGEILYGKINDYKTFSKILKMLKGEN